MKRNYFKPASIAAAGMGLAGVVLVAGCSNTDTSSKGTTSQSTQTTAPVDHSAMSHGAGGASGGKGSHDHAMGTRGVEALRKLKGREFDIAFLSQMIVHHEAAVLMAKQALQTATKPETRQEAQKVIEAQVKEVAEMTVWLKKWYDTEPSKEQQALVNADMEAMMAMPVTNDQMFFEMMIPHHQGAIDMSELVPSRSERAEVKTLAEQIIVAQKAEIERYHKLMGHGG